MPTSTVILIYEIMDYKYKETIPHVMSTNEYLIVNEQVVVQAIFQFMT